MLLASPRNFWQGGAKIQKIAVGDNFVIQGQYQDFSEEDF
jgi:hypothetical protein